LDDGAVAVSKIIGAVAHGLLAAGGLLILFHFIGAYLRGPEAFRDALDPFAAKTYLALLPLAPGALVLWLANKLAARAETRAAGAQGRGGATGGSSAASGGTGTEPPIIPPVHDTSATTTATATTAATSSAQ